MLISPLRANMFEQVKGLGLKIGDRGHHLSAACWVNGVCDAGPAWLSAPRLACSDCASENAFCNCPALSAERRTSRAVGASGVWPEASMTSCRPTTCQGRRGSRKEGGAVMKALCTKWQENQLKAAVQRMMQSGGTVCLC